MRLKILIISKTKIGNDPRPKRQVEYFTKYGWDVYTLSTQEEKNLGQCEKWDLTEKKHNFISKLKRIILLFFRKYDQFYSDNLQFNNSICAISYDIVIAHDLVTAPVAFEIQKNCQNNPLIIFDLHEYLPSQRENHLLWRWFYKPYVIYLAKKFLPKANGIVTVNENIANKYAAEFNLETPSVVRNIPNPIKTVNPVIVQEDKIRIIHHGVAFPSRGTDYMIEMMEYLDPDKFELTFMLVNPDNDSYLLKIKKKASKHKNILFIKPVLFDEIISFTNQFDIGLFLLPPLTYNYFQALPNKFFEYIHAKLAIAIGPSPEMVRIVKQYDLGVVSDTFSPFDLAQKINILDKKSIESFKENAHKASMHLNADTEMLKYIEFIQQIKNKNDTKS
jgi:glycosyltransferase involved in cell wall biosynthesis